MIGTPDERLGEEVVAVLALRPGATVTPEELTAFCKERLAHCKYPREFRFVDVLPKGERQDPEDGAAPGRCGSGRARLASGSGSLRRMGPRRGARGARFLGLAAGVTAAASAACALSSSKPAGSRSQSPRRRGSCRSRR